MMEYRTLFLALLFTTFVIVVFLPLAGAMKDPSAVYCEAMGYTYTVARMPEGPLGVCIFPEGTQVDSFRFLQGFEGKEFSYCVREGYKQQVVTSFRTCGHFGLDQCLVCTLPDGNSTEVTKLMNLSFAETVCGDKNCGMPEDTLSCPVDCRSGGWDKLCDGIRDNRCDPDCPDGLNDPDCGGVPWEGPELIYIAVLAVLAIAGASIYLFLTRKRSS